VTWETQVLNLVNTRRVLGLHAYLDQKMEEEALAYQDGFLYFDQTTVSHSVVMQMFALFVKVTVKTFGAFQVASGANSTTCHSTTSKHHVWEIHPLPNSTRSDDHAPRP